MVACTTEFTGQAVGVAEPELVFRSDALAVTLVALTKSVMETGVLFVDFFGYFHPFMSGLEIDSIWFALRYRGFLNSCHFRFLSERKEPIERKAEVFRNTNGRITLKHCVSKSSGHLLVHLDSVARYALRIKFANRLLHACLYSVSSNAVMGCFFYC